MFRNITFISATGALMAIVSMCALVNAQPQSKAPSPTPTPQPQNQQFNESKSNIKNNMALPETTSTQGQSTTDGLTGAHHLPHPTNLTKGWDGRVQGRVLVTPVTVGFDNPQDCDNFAAGRLRLNLILKNMVSGQTIKLDASPIGANFTLRSDKDPRNIAPVAGSHLTINVVIDNMSAPVSEAACGMISPSAENTGNGVNITLGYSSCDGAPAQRPGQPIGNIIVKGGKNPGGNLNIMVGDSRVTTREAAVEASNAMGVIPAVSSRGTPTPKANGF